MYFQQYIWPVKVPSRLLRVRRRRGAVSAPSPRGRYGKFVARQRKRRQIAKFNQIRSARPISAQPAPSTWTGTPRLCHGNLGNNRAAKSL